MMKIDLQKILFGEYNKESPKAKSGTPDQKVDRSIFQKITVALIFMLGVTAFIYAAIFFYPATDANVANHPLSEDLTAQKFVTSYMFFNEKEQTIDKNWTSTEYNDKNWNKILLPQSFIGKLPNFKTGPNQFILYRMKIKIPNKLKNIDQEIAFSPVYIRHSKYDVYLNGNLVSVGNMYDGNSKMLVIPIAKSYMNNSEDITIAIKGSLFSKGDTGLSHRSRWILGLESEVSKLYLHLERATNTFYLLFILAKGGIIAVFSLIFLFTSGQKGFFAFLSFAVISTLESLFTGAFLNEFFETAQNRTLTIFFFKTFAVIALFSFFVSYWNIKNQKKIVSLFAVISLVLVSLGVYGFANEKGVSVVNVLNLTNSLLIAALFASSFMGFVSYRMWKKLEVTKEKLSPLRNMLFAVTLYLALVIYQSFFSGAYTGFDIRPVYDLLFFLYVAIETMQTFGHNEKRVLSLEGHMVEKARMQQELEDAREISKVFIPHSAPQWKNIEVSIYHKPLSESSGDWFAFESSDSGRFQYFFMCDVTGHGVQAAIIVSTCRAILIALKNRKDRRNDGLRFVENYIRELNKTLYFQGEGNHLSTICALAFDLENKQVHHFSAGHPKPVRIRQDDDPKKMISVIISQPHNNLGLKDDIEVNVKTEIIENDDIYFVYTDGILFEKNIRKIRKSYKYDNQQKFETYSENLISFLKTLEKSTDEQSQPVIEEDDITLVAFKITQKKDEIEAAS